MPAKLDEIEMIKFYRTEANKHRFPSNNSDYIISVQFRVCRCHVKFVGEAMGLALFCSLREVNRGFNKMQKMPGFACVA